MCLFPKINYNAHKKTDIPFFECGKCPECLHKRASAWAVRALNEVKDNPNGCMITLTYDNYARDQQGNIVGELPPDRSLKVCKRDCQLFIKRLRKAHSDLKIKYLLSAEYGSRTGRAHYHCVLFGFCFQDIVPYKRSKRGSLIYKSSELTSLWGKGICTVDSPVLNASIVRYCTKYTAKERSDDTFMLVSRGIGEARMLLDFDGKGYVVEGRLYPIPKIIWNKHIDDCYCNSRLEWRYRGKEYDLKTRRENLSARCRFRAFRNRLPEYQEYLEFWKRKAFEYEKVQLPVVQRILQLSDEKYGRYKTACLEVLSVRNKGIPYPVPRTQFETVYARWQLEHFGIIYDQRFCRDKNPFAVLTPCLKTANDTKTRGFEKIGKKVLYFDSQIVPNPFDDLYKLHKKIKCVTQLLTD